MFSVQLAIRDRIGITMIIKRNVWAPCFEWARWLRSKNLALVATGTSIQINTEFPHGQEEEDTQADQ